MLFLDKELPKNIKTRTREIYRAFLGKTPDNLSVIVSSNLKDIPEISKRINNKLNKIIDPKLTGKKRQRAKEKVLGRMMSVDESAFFPDSNIVIVNTDTPKQTPGILAHEITHAEHQKKLGLYYDLLRSGWIIPEGVGVAGTLAGAIMKNKKMRNLGLMVLIPSALANIAAPIIDEYITSKRGKRSAGLSKKEGKVLKDGLNSYLSAGGKKLTRMAATMPLTLLL